MHCNQLFCGSGFTAGQCINQCGYNPFHPPPQNNVSYPEIVGEGEVTSVVLPDGTVQYFFIPTIKWWAPQTVNSYPYFNNMGQTNHNHGYYGSNIPAWFVRTITNPRTPQLYNNNPFFGHENSRLANTSECNLNSANIGYQLKFHNDKWTSTTHLQYFFPPRVRQIDCTISLPSKDCAAIQVDTPMTTVVHHYGSVCSKPCNCQTPLCHCATKPCDKDLNKPKSDMSLSGLVTSEDPGDPSCPKIESKNIGYNGNEQMQLLPQDSKTRRIKILKKNKTKPNNFICKCSHFLDKLDPLSSSSKNDAKINERLQIDKNVDYDCYLFADKSKATYRETGCGGGPTTSVEMQCDYDNKKLPPITWCPKTEPIAKYFQSTPLHLSDSSSSCYINTEDDINDVTNLL